MEIKERRQLKVALALDARFWNDGRTAMEGMQIAERIARFVAECKGVYQGAGTLDERIGTIAGKLGELTVEPGFAESVFDADSPDKRLLHRDPETDLHVLAHVFRPGVGGNPHSHAPSWAVYANVRGSTHMCEYDKREAADGSHAELKVTERYTMKPGDSRAYPSSAIHSPHHDETAWVIRITGGDLDKLDRWRFKKGRDRIIE